MPVKQLWLDFRAERGAEVVRSLTDPERINELPAAEFWRAQEKENATHFLPSPASAPGMRNGPPLRPAFSRPHAPKRLGPLPENAKQVVA